MSRQTELLQVLMEVGEALVVEACRESLSSFHPEKYKLSWNLVCIFALVSSY